MMSLRYRRVPNIFDDIESGKIASRPVGAGQGDIYSDYGINEEPKGELPWYLDVPLGIGAYTVGMGVGALTGPAAPVVGPLLGASAYILTKRLITGEDPEPITPMLFPEAGLENINPTLLATAEEVAMFYAAGPLFRGSGKVIRGLAKGVDKAARPLTSALVKAGEPLAEKAWDIITVITGVKAQLPTKKLLGMNKSIQEMVQPAIERLEKKAPAIGREFRNTKVESSLVLEEGRKLGRALQKEPPQVVAEVGKALKRKNMLEGIKNPKAKEIVSTFKKDIKDLSLNKKYEESFFKHFSKLMPTTFKGSDKIIKMLEKPEGTSLREIHAALDEVIKSPLSSPKAKDVAKDLWSLSARTPMEVAIATRQASFEYLTSRVKKMPGAISPTLKKGFVESQTRGLKGAIVNKDIELELQAMEKIPRIAEGLFNRYFMSPWKTNKVVLRPASHIRNLISNTLLNDGGGLPFYRQDIYMDALKGMRTNSAAWKEFKRMTGTSATNFSGADLLQINSGLAYGANIFDKMLNVYDKIVSVPRSIYSAEESLFKFAKYLHNIEKGIGKHEAAHDAVKWTFDFSDITPEIAAVGKWAVPFIRWYTKAIPLGLETAVKHPLRFAKWGVFGMALQAHAFESTGISEEEWDSLKEGMPEYMQKGMYLLMPFRDENENLQMLNLTYMLPFIGDVSELYQRSVPENIIQNPIFTMGSTLLSKRKFSGVPLYYDWEPPATKAFKGFAYAWEQFMPATVPGGTDFDKLWNAIQNKEGALSVEQAIANAAGFKLTPVDKIKNARRKDAIRRIYEQEISSSLRRELKMSTSGEETADILKKYQTRMKEVRGIE